MPALGPTAGVDLAPSFAISVNGYDIDEGVGKLITSFEYDSSDGGADMMKISFSNPDLILTDKKVIQVGNTIRLWGGFFGELKFIGGAIVEKIRPTFPAGNQMPTIEIVAYTADKAMMRNSPPASKDAKPFTAAQVKKKKKKKPEGKRWNEGDMYSDAVQDKADFYSFDADIDQTPAHIIGPMGVFQKQGMTDFVFVAGIANELGWLFWVDAKEDAGWVLHFKDPNKASDIQDQKFDFVYNQGDQSTLLSFEGEQLMGNGPTDLQVQIKNPKTGKLETFSIQGEDESDPVEYANTIDEVVIRPPIDAQEVTLSFGGVAVKVIADRRFQSPAEVKEWAQAWYRANKEDFYTGRGVVVGPGVENLTARQVHQVSGLPEPWSGDYYFSNVNHKWTSGGVGYEVTWSGRKIV